MASYVIALALAALPAYAKDPLNDFCRRWGHQTAIVDRRLYIDGGQLTWNPMSQNPLNYSNTWLLYNDLDITNQGMPQLHDDLNKTSVIPDVSGGILWADEVNKVLYLYGGEFTDSPESFTPWAYDIILDQWNQTSITAASSINRVAWGAGVTVNEIGVGYYLGGWLSNQTVPGWGGDPLVTSSLLSYDMVSDTWTNATGPDDIGKAEGVMVFLPASDGGLLIYFGGILDPYKNGTVVGSAMSTIYIYDIASTKWYTQTASGDIPDMRRKFCGGATWAQDQSSYNIYIYGGQGITNVTGFDDVYILSLPTFTWIKWWPTQPGAGRPHGLTTCNVVDNSQMIIIGGWFNEDQDCDTPTQWGTHNLNLGEDGPENAMWDLYYPNITKYSVPPEIIAKIGGGATGGATSNKPDSWDNRDLPVYFSRIPNFEARTATRSIPATATSTAASAPTNGTSSGGSSSHTAAIAGGAVGGAVGLCLILGAILFFLWRHKKNKKKGEKEPPTELPSDQPVELASNESYRDAKTAGSPFGSNVTPAYTHDGSTHTGSPQGTSPIGPPPFPVSPQTPYPTNSSGGTWPPQQYIGHPPSPGSPQYAALYGQPGTSPQQQYYPPPQTNPPYDPSQHPMHQEHFPPPPSSSVGPQGQSQTGLTVPSTGRGGTTPSDYSRSAESDSTYPPTTSNTPAHFYPQPLQVSGSRQASGTQGSPPSGSPGSEGVPLVSQIAGSIGQSPAPERMRQPQPVRGRFREEGHE